MRNRISTVLCLLIGSFAGLHAAGNNVQGVVHDPQHRPVPGAGLSIESKPGTVLFQTQSDSNGEFTFPDAPPGPYVLRVTAAGFAETEIEIPGGTKRTPVIHVQLEVAAIRQQLEVSGAASKLATGSSTVATFVSKREIVETPGASLSNSLAMITDFTPGAYMVHDMLHMRGGHQVNWFFDGIPVVNTNIAANVATLINPKNVDELEVERGGYSSEYGDRTYGFFNVVTPSGFDMDNQGELIVAGGSQYTTDDQLRLGGHTARFAYYASVDANRSNLGLETPVSEALHDQESGVGGFLSLMFNPGANDQVRLVSSVRGDHYQIPNTPDQQASGIRDLDLEQDQLAGLRWVHSTGDGVLFSVAPYYHRNATHYVGGPQDTPYILNDNNRSSYFGGRAVLQAQKKRHNARVGFEAWGQHDQTFFGLTAAPGGSVLNQQERHWANSDAVFLEDEYQAAKWLRFDLGIRLTHYGGLANENAADPRVGAAIRIPRIDWIVRGYYAYYYQPPPLDSVAGPLLQFAVNQGFGFVPLRGERDIQHDFGLTIPWKGWTLEADSFHTSARNFLDHDVIGNSGIFVPLTDLGAIISGTEVTIRAPEVFHAVRWRVAYSNQIGQAVGPITGGLLESSNFGNFLLDHDQRNTLSSVLAIRLPDRVWFNPSYTFGSGFLNGGGPSHLPPHSTFDLSIGKRFGENVTVSANGLNLGNSRYLLDTSNTFGGTHYINPRQIYGELRFKFDY